MTPLNPSARHTSELVHRVARELRAAGWDLRAVSTDNGSEFRSQIFRWRWPRRERSTASSTPAGPRATAAWSGCSGPGGVLAAQLRPLSDPQVHRPAPRPQPLPALLQLRAGPHRPPHPRPFLRPPGIRRLEDAPLLSTHLRSCARWTSHACLRKRRKLPHPPTKSLNHLDQIKTQTTSPRGGSHTKRLVATLARLENR